ncbi:MAG: nuclear transport factor 2 family protein [Neomegalonema sp.]|nr:nuclear transport factor 2 family protein [Neomegalonema sp.]
MNSMSPSDFVTHYEAALATQKWEAVSPLIHPRATVIFSDGSVHNGKKAVQIAFERNFNAIKSEIYKISNVHWLLDLSDNAAFFFDFSWRGVVDGAKISGSGRGSSILICEHGKWQLLMEHLGPSAD